MSLAALVGSPMGMMARLLALDARSLLDIARAQVALIVAQWIVWRRPLGHLVSARETARSAVMVRPSREVVREAVRLAVAVRRASRYSVLRPACLVRSVALQRLLETHGIPGSEVWVGVRRSDGDLLAHAWVELEGQLLGEDARLARDFVRLADVRLL